MKAKLIFIRFVGTFGTLRLDEKSFIKTFLGFTPNWDFEPTIVIHADSSGNYTTDKFLNLTAIDKIHLKSDVIDGSVVEGLRQPVLYSFVLDDPSGYEVFCEP